MYFYDFPIISNESNLPVFLVTMGLHELQPHIERESGYPYPQILYSTKGTGVFIYENKKIEIRPYTAIFIPAGLKHSYYPTDEIWDIHWIALSGYASDSLLKGFGLENTGFFSLGDIKILEHYFRKMHEALVADKIFGNYRASGFLYDFLIEFYRLISASDTAVTANPAVIRAIDYININYTEEISMEDLCNISGVSKQHLCRLFRSALNSRPMEYIAKRRIQAAKELLTNTSLPIEEISEETGFCTSSYFCKLFRRYEGLTPSQFRRG